jgi:ADP-heptose:LPS heptosyltransferase
LAASSLRRKILIIRLGAFGDVLQSAGAIHDIRIAHPQDEVTLLTTKPFRRIYERCPWLDRIILDPRKPRHHIISLLRLRKELKNEHFDIIYDLQNSSRTLMYRNWLDAEWSQKDEAFLSVQSKKLGHQLSILERLRFQLEQAGVATPHTMRPDVSWMADNVAALMQLNGLKSGFILLFPGSSLRHPQKRWPHYSALSQSLINRGFKVVTAPGPDERALCQSLPAQTLLDKGNPINFNALAGLIQQAKLIIGNDTGPTHLAAYLGAKGIALFGQHTSARATGLDRFLEIIEVQNLNELQPTEVMARIERLTD